MWINGYVVVDIAMVTDAIEQRCISVPMPDFCGADWPIRNFDFANTTAHPAIIVIGNFAPKHHSTF